MEVVINKCYGGFSLSKKAYEFMGLPWDGHGFAFQNDEMRTDPRLIECVRALGDEANGSFSDLKIVDVPDDVEWHIEDYDGIEWVAENHRTWD